MKFKQIQNILYIIIAFTAIGIGCVGIILPVLPTTPFMLLALFCFAKGSDRFHKWFVSTKLYRRYLQDFVKTRGMKLKTKLVILIMASIALLTVLFLSKYLWLKIVIGILIFVKYYIFIFKIKTLKDDVSYFVGKERQIFPEKENLS